MVRTHEIDNKDRLPPPAPHADSAPWQQQRRWLPDWRSLAVLCGFAVILLLILYWLFGRDVRQWIAFGGGDKWVQGILWIAFGYVLLRAIISAAMRGLIIEQRGYKVPVWQASDALDTLARVDLAYAERLYPNAAAVTISQTPAMPMLDAPYEEAEIVPEEDVIGLVPDSEWLSWLTEMPHTMIAGGTGTGKTTLSRIELYERLHIGYAGIVLDPKGKDWYGLPVFGGGRDFEAILSVLDQLHSEMASRFREYNDGQRQFQPIKVLVDEVPDIMDSCLDMRRKLVDGRWSRFARQLGSLAREIGMSVTLMTQSPLVEDIGMNSAMRKNFTRIALGDEAPRLLREERDNKRRAQLQDLLRGQQYPAAMMRRGQVYLLDTSNVPRLAQRYLANPLHWSVAMPQPVKPVVSAAAQAGSAVSTSVPVPGALPQSLTKPAEQIAYLAATTNLGTRAIRERLGCDYNLVVDIAGKVRGPRGAQLRAHYQSMA